MVGSTIRPIVTVVAPTTPLAAASSVPTMHDRNAEAAAQRAEQPAHRLEQVLGDARALQHHAHEDEQRDRQQHSLVITPKMRCGSAPRKPKFIAPSEVAERGEGERHAAERQRHRIAGEQQAADRDHHQDGEDFGEAASSARPRAEHVRRADRLRDALQRQQQREQRDQRLEQEHQRQAAGLARALQDRPGARDIGQREPERAPA